MKIKIVGSFLIALILSLQANSTDQNTEALEPASKDIVLINAIRNQKMLFLTSLGCDPVRFLKDIFGFDSHRHVKKRVAQLRLFKKLIKNRLYEVAYFYAESVFNSDEKDNLDHSFYTKVRLGLKDKLTDDDDLKNKAGFCNKCLERMPDIIFVDCGHVNRCEECLIDEAKCRYVCDLSCPKQNCGESCGWECEHYYEKTQHQCPECKVYSDIEKLAPKHMRATCITCDKKIDKNFKANGYGSVCDDCLGMKNN